VELEPGVHAGDDQLGVVVKRPWRCRDAYNDAAQTVGSSHSRRIAGGGGCPWTCDGGPGYWRDDQPVDTLRGRRDLLLSVIGVRETLAASPLAEMPEPGGREMVAYAGLNPSNHRSGTSID
jgi:hypothetical protein